MIKTRKIIFVLYKSRPLSGVHFWKTEEPLFLIEVRASLLQTINIGMMLDGGLFEGGWVVAVVLYGWKKKASCTVYTQVNSFVSLGVIRAYSIYSIIQYAYCKGCGTTTAYEKVAMYEKTYERGMSNLRKAAQNRRKSGSLKFKATQATHAQNGVTRAKSGHVATLELRKRPSAQRHPRQPCAG